MSLITDQAILRIIESVAVILTQAYRLARVRISACASPVLRLMAPRDHINWEMDLLRQKLGVLRAQRTGLLPHKWPD